jgi:hypothetical protein
VSNRHVGPGPISAGDIPEEERPKGTEPAGWRPFDLRDAPDRCRPGERGPHVGPQGRVEPDVTTRAAMVAVITTADTQRAAAAAQRAAET